MYTSCDQVVKKAGVIIKPIQFDEVCPQDKSEEAQDKNASGGRRTEKGNREKHTKKAKGKK